MAGGAVILGLLGTAAFIWQRRPLDQLPNPADYATPQEKKTAFIECLLPDIREINADILAERRRLMAIRQKLAAGGTAGYFDDRWIRKTAAAYELEVPARLNVSYLDRLLLRVDIIPPSLVLAQAAEESGWGTSRFALHGNNLFGVRAYDGTGLVPRRRARGEDYKVAVYESLRDSIVDYVHNLNTGENYLQLRANRRDQRRQRQSVSGEALAAGLEDYSGRGPDYIETIQSIIRLNKLGRFDS